MQLIDTHVQMDALFSADLEAMAAAGITAVVADAAGGKHVVNSSQAALHFFERTLGGETTRAAEFFIDVYVLLGMKMVAIPPDYEKVLEALPEYLSRDKVVGIGEVGLESGEDGRPDLSKQEEVLKAELRLAKEYNKAVVLHLPATERSRWIERYFKFIEEAKLEPGKVVIVHADSATTKLITDFGCIAGISVMPARRITPEDGARIVANSDISRVLVASDTHLRLRSDALGVPRTALQMRRLGFTEEDITRVFYHNPKRIFNLG